MSWIEPIISEITSPVSLVECNTTSENKIFRTTIDNHHSYCKFRNIPARNIRWLVYESVSGNLVGAIGLSSATIAVSCRDTFIGWSNEMKMKHLGKLANNSRFCLIKENITIKNVGSMSLKQLRIVGTKRWHEKYGDDLIMIETFVEPERFIEYGGQLKRAGSVYKADNWQVIGLTAGTSIRKTPLKLWARERGERGKLARENPKEALKQYAGYLGGSNGSGFAVTRSQKKLVIVKPLVSNWKDVLTT